MKNKNKKIINLENKETVIWKNPPVVKVINIKSKKGKKRH